MTRPKETKKVVLAYSGGLDTSIIVPWLKENYGSASHLLLRRRRPGRRAERPGGEGAWPAAPRSAIVEDLREEFVRDYLFPLLQAGAVYERNYLLGTSLARPLIAKRQVRVAEPEGADALAHGCTGKGNDQVRFELTYMALRPAPEGDRALARVGHPLARGRARLRRRAQRAGRRRRSSDLQPRRQHLAHLARGRRPRRPLERAARRRCSSSRSRPRTRPTSRSTSTIGFERGRAGRRSTASGSARSTLLDDAQRDRRRSTASGRLDLVENRLVGMKSRGVYETPGGTVLQRGAPASSSSWRSTATRCTTRMSVALATPS